MLIERGMSTVRDDGMRGDRMRDDGVRVRRELAGDAGAVRGVVEAAFSTAWEADLLDALRRDPAWIPELSYVCVDSDGEIVGYSVLSRCHVGSRPGVLLGPVAVSPPRQKSGVGMAVVSACLEGARAAGERFAVVLGHPSYYPRFGFRPASTVGITAEFSAPDDAFMAMSLAGDDVPGGDVSGGDIPGGMLAMSPPFERGRIDRLRFTERLRLEPIGDQHGGERVMTRHVDDVWRLHDDPAVAEWFSGRWSRETAAEKATELVRGWTVDGIGKWLAYDRESDELIGRGGLAWREIDGIRRLEIGWTVASAHWGRGYATEIGRAGLSCAFDELEVNEVISFTEQHNARSRAVMERLGMTESGPIRLPGLLASHSGVHPDAPFALYTLSRDSWIASSGRG